MKYLCLPMFTKLPLANSVLLHVNLLRIEKGLCMPRGYCCFWAVLYFLGITRGAARLKPYKKYF